MAREQAIFWAEAESWDEPLSKWSRGEKDAGWERQGREGAAWNKNSHKSRRVQGSRE